MFFCIYLLWANGYLYDSDPLKGCESIGYEFGYGVQYRVEFIKCEHEYG